MNSAAAETKKEESIFEEESNYKAVTIPETKFAPPGAVMCNWCCGDGCKSCNYKGIKTFSYSRGSSIL